MDAGYEPVYGARPLRRAIQRLVQDPLSYAILEGRFQKNDSIQVSLEETNEDGTPRFGFHQANNAQKD